MTDVLQYSEMRDATPSSIHGEALHTGGFAPLQGPLPVIRLYGAVDGSCLFLASNASGEPPLLAVGSTARLAWPDGGQRETSSPQRQISYLAFPCSCQAAFSQQEHLFQGTTDGQGTTDFTPPGIGWPSWRRSYAYRVMVETSCVRSTRPSCAAHASTAGSSVPDNPTSWSRTRSNAGWRRNKPRTMLPLQFSSAASKSMATAHDWRDVPTTAPGPRVDHNAPHSVAARSPAVCGVVVSIRRLQRRVVRSSQ